MWGGNGSGNNSNNNDDPFRDMDNMVRRLFNLDSGVLHGTPFGGSNMRGSFLSTSSRGNWLPAVNLVETHSQFQLSADAAGMRREDMEVSVKDNRVCVKGNRQSDVQQALSGTTDKQQGSGEQPVYHMYERGFGSFERCVTLPTKIREDSVAAQFVDGVLTVTMQKEESGSQRGSPISIR
jgi:HSP20 family protein